MNFANATNGLIPAIIQDSKTFKVLMLVWMNEEALQKSSKEKKLTFYSKPKNKLYTKGEISGNYLFIDDILEDEKDQTLLIKVFTKNNAGLKNSETSFKEKNKALDAIYELEEAINNHKKSPQKNSYTSKLFEKGINKISQKLGEEAFELVIEAKDKNIDLFKEEAADLLYHFLVLLAEKSVDLHEVLEIIKKRSGKKSIN